ncbi:hypothetical protein MLD38_019042 [Melastoma candidum]|uniref:Uncharacterized protein n=1 Tax=Melastoma candidum TaxID=119954 RepID=A0ACB9QUX3_9MYRT|nr:hypothetical protein MLD38_019042 [Melastoma candidum]
MLRSTLLRAKTLITIPKAPTTSGLIHHPLFFFFFSTQSQSPIARDLASTHGFPIEAAETLASLIGPKLRKKYPPVLSLFRDYGFSHSDITTILIRNPSLLGVNAYQSLKPKLDALVRHGIEGTTLVQVVSGDPYILRLSLSVRLDPCLRCLSRFFGRTPPLVDLFLVRRGTWVLHKFNNDMEENIDTLRESGVPDDKIVKMMIIRPRTLCRDPAEFRRMVSEIKELGMDVKSLMFIKGIVTRAGMKANKWAAKVEVFKKFGWTEREITRLFVKLPIVMESSVEKIEKALDYFLNQLGWTKEDVMTYPSLLFASLENKIKPRMSVLQVLASEGLITKKGMQQGLLLTADNFMARYVVKYKHRTKHVLDAL